MLNAEAYREGETPMDGLEFLDTLNPAQREAAETTEGYIRVIAGF